jgi:hypothetical protein
MHVPVDGGFDMGLDGRTRLRDRPAAPCLFAGHGDPLVAMHRGNFDIADWIDERLPLRYIGQPVVFIRDFSPSRLVRSRATSRL